MMSRRGYGSSELNTDDFVLNASINQPFFKGKLIARIEAFDLLHQLSNTQYTVNAQGRTETRPTRIGSARITKKEIIQKKMTNCLAVTENSCTFAAETNKK